MNDDRMTHIMIDGGRFESVAVKSSHYEVTNGRLLDVLGMCMTYGRRSSILPDEPKLNGVA